MKGEGWISFCSVCSDWLILVVYSLAAQMVCVFLHEQHTLMVLKMYPKLKKSTSACEINYRFFWRGQNVADRHLCGQ